MARKKVRSGPEGYDVDKRVILVSAVLSFITVFFILASENVSHAQAVLMGVIPASTLFMTFHIDQAAFLIYSTLLAILVAMVYLKD